MFYGFQSDADGFTRLFGGDFGFRNGAGNDSGKVFDFPAVAVAFGYLRNKGFPVGRVDLQLCSVKNYSGLFEDDIEGHFKAERFGHSPAGGCGDGTVIAIVDLRLHVSDSSDRADLF